MRGNYPRYSKDPYNRAETPRQATIYRPDDYHLSLIASIPAVALRVWFIMAAHVDPTTGRIRMTTKHLRDLLGTKASNVSAAKTKLIRANLIQYAQRPDEFYLNPAAFRPISIDF